MLRPHELVGPSLGTGVFGGYLYMNGSAMRLFGVRMPGMSVRDADEQVMGEVTDLPPYRPAKGDRNLRRLTGAGPLRVQADARARISMRSQRARADARAWLATMPDLGTAVGRAAAGWLDTYPPRMRRA